MMTEPTAVPAREAEDLDARYRAASQAPRGDWGNVGFVIVGDDEDEEGTDDAGR